MYYLFYDIVWKAFETNELPVKPNSYDYPTEGWKAHEENEAWEKYNQAIATLKSKALPVANPDILADGIKNYSEKLNGVKISAFVYVEGEFYEWPGTVEKIHKTNCGKINTCTFKDCNDAGHCTMNETIYILSLPKPDMSDKEPIDETYYLKGPDEFVKGEPAFNNGGQIPAYGNERTARQLIAELTEENTRLRKLIEKAFVSGRSRTTWEQFKKDNGL